MRWLRSNLLVFDQIQVIRPSDVIDPEYHAANQAVFDLLPDAFDEIRQTHYQMALDPPNEELLLKTVDLISRKFRRPRTLEVRVDKGGQVSFPGYTFLHVSKLPSFIDSELERRGLIQDTQEKLLEKLTERQYFRVVQRDASNVILALIADHYARDRSA